jgi:glyceraldehyde-3-phosphate dehydrogenase/erythrose-4-phosphate dehydrogenase
MLLLIRNPEESTLDGELGVDLVFECTGIFRNEGKGRTYTSKRVQKTCSSLLLVRAPVVQTIVLGVNDDELDRQPQCIF